MLPLAHAGIALGAAFLLDRALFSRHTVSAEHHDMQEDTESSAEVVAPASAESPPQASRWSSLGSRIDLRLLLIASLLPDIVDKPVGQYLFRETFSTGRIFCHTLLFLIIIAILGLYLYRTRGRLWLLVVSFGVFTHLLMDEMWVTPRTFLWPLYGLAFEPEDLSVWSQKVWHALFSDPAVFVPELVGAAVLIWFLAGLVGKGRVYAFIRSGEVT